MRDLLNALFDFQRFENNSRLSALIRDTESRFDNALSDEDLEWVSAAEGTFFRDPLAEALQHSKENEPL